ncbi:uncharacterized protein mideasb isoform X2 [Scyliorhinus torazame]|uniref:uncharacterized protein mideasb isoform X2 n=1 Tax=Scyliorhinus torazame TaxID=75743 RepID=UPI003B5CAB3C
MNVQAPGKSSAKRKGKQISFFGENTGIIQSSPPLQRKNGMIRSEAEVSGGLVNTQPPMVLEAPARVGQCQSVASDLGINRGSGAATENTMPPNWAASVLIDHLPTKGSLNWKPPCSWTQNVAPFCGSIGSILNSNTPSPFSHMITKQGATNQLQKQQLQQTQLQHHHQQQKPPQHQHHQQQIQPPHQQQIEPSHQQQIEPSHQQQIEPPHQQQIQPPHQQQIQPPHQQQIQPPHQQQIQPPHQQQIEPSHQQQIQPPHQQQIQPPHQQQIQPPHQQQIEPPHQQQIQPSHQQQIQPSHQQQIQPPHQQQIQPPHQQQIQPPHQQQIEPPHQQQIQPSHQQQIEPPHQQQIQPPHQQQIQPSHQQQIQPPHQQQIQPPHQQQIQPPHQQQIQPPHQQQIQPPHQQQIQPPHQQQIQPPHQQQIQPPHQQQIQPPHQQQIQPPHQQQIQPPHQQQIQPPHQQQIQPSHQQQIQPPHQQQIQPPHQQQIQPSHQQQIEPPHQQQIQPPHQQQIQPPHQQQIQPPHQQQIQPPHQQQIQPPHQQQIQPPHQQQIQPSHQQQIEPPHQQQIQPPHQQQIQPPHQQQIQPPHQQQIQPPHQQQIQPPHQQQNQPQYQAQQQNQLHRQLQQHQLQHQQAQLLHQHQHQQQSNEALPQHQFFQYSFSQSQKQELPPKTVLNVFHQPHQPSLLPLYSHQAQNMCQQHIFQQFFPHQQPPQSLGLRRVQVSQGSDPSQHIVSTAAQFQQLSEAQVRKSLQKSTVVGHKPKLPPRQLVTEFQVPSAKLAQYSFKERKTKLSLFELQRLENPPCTAENARQHWPQAYGPELQKLLNVPPNHCVQNQLKLFEVDSLPSKSVQADKVDGLSPKEQEKTQLSQDSKRTAQVAAQEPASPADEAAAGVVHNTTRKGRISNETNGLEPQHVSTEPLSSRNSSAETLANDSREESKRRTAGHSKATVESAATRGQLDDGCLMPLVIPVSVPVRKMDSVTTNTDRTGEGESQRNLSSEKDPSDLSLSLLTSRRRRLSRGSGMEHSAQEDASSRGHVNPTAKLKRRPRPEPLFIPPKPLNHVSVITYPPGTLYQSNLRSPVRLLDHPLDKNFQPPPYTPPPILSPMREGSGLYFNAFLSSTSNSSQPVTPRSTPKTSLTQSNSAETPPPVLSLMNETTPASIEPRINIGPKFQAAIPELQDRFLAALDANHADLVFMPWEGHKTNRLNQQRVDNLMTLACSSILPGGGTNQELVFHCLHESKGNTLAAMNMLLIKKTPRGRSKALLNYHYAGSDKWTSAEKKMFNKGLAAHKKDFFLVQKLDSLPRRARVPIVTEVKKEEEDEEEDEQGQEEEYSPDHKKLILTQAKVAKNEQNSAVHSQGVHLRKNPDPTYRCSYRPRQPAVTTAAPRMLSRSEQAQSGATAKPAKQSQENIFPCKKCGKVFSKVKSRSAHMKSHSVQEKKQREAELKSRIMAEEEQTVETDKYKDYSYCYQDV